MSARASRRSGGSGSSAVRMCWPDSERADAKPRPLPAERDRRADEAAAVDPAIGIKVSAQATGGLFEQARLPFPKSPIRVARHRLPDSSWMITFRPSVERQRLKALQCSPGSRGQEVSALSSQWPGAAPVVAWLAGTGQRASVARPAPRRLAGCRAWGRSPLARPGPVITARVTLADFRSSSRYQPHRSLRCLTISSPRPPSSSAPA
jgi:hypothetical protein